LIFDELAGPSRRFSAGGFLMFHLASGLIHLPLLLGVISCVAHLFTGTKAAPAHGLFEGRRPIDLVLD
jgi:hypothetical protein